ncbi:MAG: sensor signal transduction histidine kinase, partial [Verrucomicrobiales bacterium]|nr:sensor signal transduction histidine kinase [Verrucomicrobiales bacterium]
GLDAVQDVVRVITEDSRGDIWIGMGVQLNRFIPKTGKTTVYLKMDGVPINMIRTIQEDDKGTLWFGSNMSLHSFKNERWTQFTQKSGIGHNVVSALCQDRSGNLWVGNYGGLSRIENGKLSVELNGSSEPFDVINVVLEDLEGNIWLAAKDGIYQLRSRRVEVYTRQQGLTYQNVTAVLEDHSGTVWMATWGGGLNRLKDGAFTAFNTKNSVASDLLLSLCEDHDGSLWVGTDYGAGLYHLKNGFFKYHGPEKGVSTAAIRVIYRDRQTNLWLGTSTSLELYNPEKPIIYTRKDGLAGNSVRSILQDRKDNLWIGTTNGLSCLKDGKFTNLTTNQGLSDNSVLALCEDADQTLWIGTEKGGLNRLQNGKVTAYTKRLGLLNEEVFEILDDGLGNLWIASLNGISRVSKKSLADFDRGTVTNIACTLYGKDDGMVSIQCNGISKPAGWKSKDGRLWFATTKGVAVIDPGSSLEKNTLIPPVIIEEFLVDKQPIKSLGTNVAPLQIAPTRGELEFHYTALSLQVPEKNRFKYKLEGVDDNWVDAGARRVAYYNNIAPGDYRFRVIACNNDGAWNETGASLAFHLTPHFYQTGWFSSSCVLAVGLGLGAIYRLNVRRLRKRQRVLEALVEERTKHLKTEIAERQRVQTQLIDVSRQAGMAEVASGVLHNVGNVLNSVNVSATLAMDRLRTSKHSSLEKASVMIRENSADLGTFFTLDPKGKHFPDYLAKLSTHMTEEHGETVKELTFLCKNVDHIKEIISMQQKYARIGGVIQSVKVSELIKDALQMNAVALARNTLQFHHEYIDDPVISTDKHKVLQILINLIRNAQEACEAGGKPEQRLTVRTTLKGPFIRIVATDNGVGIRPEVLTKIFSHGFTTRQNGHGFGLHNSALAAKELGGSLIAQSEGQNCGATFILEIPLEPPQQDADHSNGFSM